MGQINFSDVFKSSFLEKAASFSVIDVIIAFALAFAVGLFIRQVKPVLPSIVLLS